MPKWLRSLTGKPTTGSSRKTDALLSRVSELHATITKLDDETLKKSLADAAASGDDAQALAGLREAARRTLGLEPFDCQLLGLLNLKNGHVIQMATGEGKTLVGALAAGLYGLQGKKVHCITVNSYLARRDAEWMAPLFDLLGLSCGAIGEDTVTVQRRDIYSRDIIFGSIAEFGFDMLRDHIVTDRSQQVRQPADVAIVDEADSVMVDEALVPLVLAGSAPGQAPTGRINNIVAQLELGRDYSIDSDRRNVFLTDQGALSVERELGIDSLYDSEHISSTLVQVNVALHAKELLQLGVHYIIRDGKVALVDSSKGRVADLQRWPDGLQSAVEAKEGLDVSEGGRILDSLTIQAVLGTYDTVCGMTGTAVPASEQFRQFYGLDVTVIDTHKPCVRDDQPDRVFVSEEDKLRGAVDYIREQSENGRPVLVGTHNVTESEELAEELKNSGIDSVILNAKNDKMEAGIVAQAGLPGRVTVSTQMAGRGTDIRLGGVDEQDRDAVVSSGGLAVVGYGRHRSARLDNQLRGRAGRQGDPGSSIFFVSLADDMVEVGGGGEHISAKPSATGELTDKKVLHFVEHCQRVTEGQMLQIHANTWKYNKLINDQRTIIDEYRAKVLDTELALDELRERSDRVIDVSHEAEVTAARQVLLFYVDDKWSDHLSYLNDLRESIHLRALARESPIDEFHRLSITAFKTLLDSAVEEAAHAWQTVEIDEYGAHLESSGLSRPSSTWTYMISDNPLSGNSGSVVGSVVNMFR